jgi:formate/nitrite transporter
MNSSFLTPAEIAEYAIGVGVKKSTLSISKMLLLGILAGAFIALASQGSNLAMYGIPSVGLARVLGGTVFPAGLILVVLCGAELFTGNCLIVMSCINGKSKWGNFAKNLFFVYVGNLAGSLIVTLLVSACGQWNYTSGALGAYTIRVAVSKVSLTFAQAFFSGILCNWLVCLAVWVAFAAKDITGKILGIFFPIWLFVLSGFEHCIANMYYIPAGMLAANNPAYLARALETYYDGSQAALANLTMAGFVVNNLVPVTLGNIAGGGLFVGVIYYIIYIQKSRQRSSCE